MDEYYYSGSDFYASEDARIDAAFTDVRELPCLLAGCTSVCARRFGSWWTLTGVAATGAQHVEAQQKLRRCFSQMVTLNHPNITRAVAMLQTSLMPDECIIEEYVDGLTLDEWMRTAPDEPLRHKVLEQTVDALQYCHHKGVVHGNLSPQSVMVTHQERVAKLVAFGCEGQPEDDLRALGDIIEVLQLPGLKHVVESCRDGKITSIDDVVHALRHRESGKWLPRALVVLALLAVVVGGAFWAGHRVSLSHDNQLADSLPLPAIYFSDTVQLAVKHYGAKLVPHRSMLTGANMYQVNDYRDIPGDIPEDVAVDLGLSVLWAPFNVGSADANVNITGNAFTWCDTLGVGIHQPVDKYWPQSRPMIDIAGTESDAVRRIWGGNWRMPTQAEWHELVTKCKWILLLERGIPPGYRVHGPSGAEIFLPLAGYGLRYRGHDLGVAGYYWSSTPVAGADREAHALRIDTAAIDIGHVASIDHGYALRPVLDKR